MVFSLFSKGKKRSEELLTVSLEAVGLVFRGTGPLAGMAAAQWLAKGHEIPGTQGDAILYLSQLEQDCVGPTFNDQFILEWADFYRLRQFEDHADGLALLNIPPTCTLSPELLSRGALSDHDFSIGLAWSDDRETRSTSPARVAGYGMGWSGASCRSPHGSSRKPSRHLPIVATTSVVGMHRSLPGVASAPWPKPPGQSSTGSWPAPW